MKLASAAALTGLSNKALLAKSSSPKKQQYGMWLGIDKSDEELKRLFERMRKSGITMILPNTPHEKIDRLHTLVPAAADEGLDVHAWRPTMVNEDPLETHPEWYGISRSGKSAATNPPYVNYYHFLCPNRVEVEDFLRTRMRTLAEVPGIKSVHLDYIRFPDVILPVGLWKTYHLVQDREYHDFDFCYCAVCRDAFKTKTGIDPLSLGDDAPANQEWVKFRWDSITSLVSKFYDDVHARGKLLTGAVFPTPAIARKLVRQDWVNWQIDAVMPMMYHSFYEQPVSWIGDATREDVSALEHKRPLYSGVYIPALTPDEMQTATSLALANGADGVVYFDAGSMTDAQWQRLARILRS